ncbi:hypothetical protein AAG906_038344 [Vitis piasezkii]
MPKTRGGHTSAPQSSERAAPVRAPLDAPPHLADSASQSRYHTRRASATPVAPTQITPRGPPTKKAKTSGPGESSRAPRDSQSQPPSARRPRPSSHRGQLRLPIQSISFDVVPHQPFSSSRYKREARAILEALFRIFEGYYFGPHHLIMAALLHFEEKVHKRCLTRAASIQLLFPRLLCHVLAHMGFPADPQAEPRRHCRESFSLEHWTQLSLHQHSPELPEPREVPPAPSTSVPLEPVPEAASSDAPPAVPPTAEPPITIPGSEYRTAMMERMDHFQTQQDQQTLILREIQQHLGLVPPAPPVAVPTSVPAEDPSYPPEEPTT